MVVAVVSVSTSLSVDEQFSSGISTASSTFRLDADLRVATLARVRPAMLLASLGGPRVMPRTMTVRYASGMPAMTWEIGAVEPQVGHQIPTRWGTVSAGVTAGDAVVAIGAAQAAFSHAQPSKA